MVFSGVMKCIIRRKVGSEGFFVLLGIVAFLVFYILFLY